MSSIINKVKDALNPDDSPHGSESKNSGQRTYDEYDDPSNSRVGGAQQQQYQQGAVGSGRNTRSSAAAAGGRDEYGSAGGAGYDTNAANYSNMNTASSGLDASDPTFGSSGRSGRTAGAGAGAGAGAAYGDTDPTFASSGRSARTTGAGAGGYDNVGTAGYNNPDDFSSARGQTGARTAGNTGGVRGSDDPTFASTGRTGAGAGAGNAGYGAQQTANAQRGAQSSEGSHLQQGGLRNTVDDIKDKFSGSRGGAGGNNYP